MRLLKTFSNGSTLCYDTGRFDDLCVYLAGPTVPRHAPKDVGYFTTLLELGAAHGRHKVYADFVRVYESTGRAVDQKVFAVITEVAGSYANDALNADVVLSILHAAMVAEENKANTRLGKRVKRLGVHLVLIEGVSPAQASNFSRGMKWTAIDAECRRRGF